MSAFQKETYLEYLFSIVLKEYSQSMTELLGYLVARKLIPIPGVQNIGFITKERLVLEEQKGLPTDPLEIRYSKRFAFLENCIFLDKINYKVYCKQVLKPMNVMLQKE
jgi:hypothetical protein